MPFHFFRMLGGACSIAAMPLVWAQTGAPSTPLEGAIVRPSPLQNPVPLRYQSVMTQYRPYSDQIVGSWAEANRTVEQVGGWRAYAREASQPESEGVKAPAAHGTGTQP